VYSLDILAPNVKEFTSPKEDALSVKESDRNGDESPNLPVAIQLVLQNFLIH
jgi:hypothetical protein